MNRAPETIEQQTKDSDMIFKAIVCGDFTNIDQVKAAICLFWVPDMSVSRAGISHAIGRLEREYMK